jgi:hypothetical protein
MSPYLVAENFISDKYSLNVSFTQDQNASYFGSSGAQRYYKLLLDLYNRGLKSSALLSVFHYPAIITGIVVNDFYTPVVIGTGENETGNLSGQVNFDITFTGGIGTNYIVKSLDIYTGASSGTPSSLNGFSLLKNVSVFDDSQTQNFIILNTEVPNNTGLFYKFRAYDDFGAGITFANSVSGYLGYVEPPLFFGVAIPPALNEYQRITGYFTGLDSPVRTTGRDGAIVFQDDENLDQDFYVLKSGQWKTLAIYEEITGKFARFVQAPAVSTGLGQLGDFAVSGQYLYTATGANKWGRTLLSDWYGPIGSFSWSGSGNNGIAYISWTSADQATGYIVYRAETALTGTYQQIFSGTGNSYNDAVPAPDNVWFYNVAAFNDSYISSGTAAAINVPP